MNFNLLASGLRIATLSGTLCVGAVAQVTVPEGFSAENSTTATLNTSAASDNATATRSMATSLTQQDVDKILSQAENAAKKTASAEGLRSTADQKKAARFHIFVVDRMGNIRGRRSQDDAWTGSVDIALGKARTAAFFSSNENALTSRQLGEWSQSHGPDGTGPAGPLWGIANTNYPSGDGANDAAPEIKKNALVTFPGGLPLYKDGRLVGGIGVSGDGVDQDEAVAFAGAEGFMPDDEVGTPTELEAKSVESVQPE